MDVSSQALSSIKIRVVLIGGMKVGKTSMAYRFVEEKFDPDQVATIGVDYLWKILKIGSTEVEYEIWDTAGQEKYRCVAVSYIRGSQAIVAVYDLSDPDTVQEMIDMVNSVTDKLGHDIPLYVVGNKSDLSCNVPEGIADFCSLNDAMSFVTSAKTGEGIRELFYTIGKNEKSRKMAETKVESRIVDIDKNRDKKPCSC